MVRPVSQTGSDSIIRRCLINVRITLASGPQRVITACRMRGDRRLHGIAGVAQVEKLHALDETAVLDVEAGNDTDLEHGCAN
jgi:hypothetical protein